MTACRLVVFDLFGTTVAEDGSVDAALRAVLDGRGLSYDDEALTAVRGLAKREALRAIVADRPGIDVDALYDAFKDELRTRWARRPLQAAAGAAEAIATVAALGLEIAITTGLERDLAQAALDAVRLPAAGLIVVCAEDVGRGRPAPDMIHRAMALAKVDDAGAVACVGDTTADLRAGAAAGVGWNVGVLGGAHGENRLREAPHTAIIDSLRGLPGAIDLARVR